MKMHAKMGEECEKARSMVFFTWDRRWAMVLWCLWLAIVCLAASGVLLSLFKKEPMEEDVPMLFAFDVPDEIPLPPMKKPAGWGKAGGLNVPANPVDVPYPDADLAERITCTILTVPAGPMVEPYPDQDWEGRISRAGGRMDWRPLPGDSCHNPSGFAGRLYDFKEFSSGGESGMSADDCRARMVHFVQQGWDEGVFAEYASHSVYVGAGLFFCPMMGAEEALALFAMQEKVRPQRWAAVFRGRVKAPKTGRFRFVGAGDEVLAVRFDGQLVLKHGRSEVLPHDSGSGEDAELQDLFFYESAGSIWNEELGGLRAGEPFDVVQDRWYSMDVLVASLDGSTFGYALLVDEGTASVRKADAQGVPVFPLFRTLFVLPSSRDASERNLPVVPYDADSPVWSNDGMHFGEESPAGMCTPLREG